MEVYYMKRAEQKEKRRKEILIVGLDLFIRKGLASTKIQDIADAANMSTGLMFNYFESKEKLYEELIKIGIETPEKMLNSVDGEGLIYFETVARQIFNLFKTENYIAKMFVLMNQAKHNEAVPETVKPLFDGMDYVSVSVNKIEQGQKDLTIKDGDPAALAVAFWGAISGIAEEIALGKNNVVPESDWVVDILRRKPNG
jgi:AcrR family transcriptional regulator